jgi:hypothetical protein
MERIKLALGAVLMFGGLLTVLLSIVQALKAQIGIPAGILAIAAGALVYRTTILHKIASKGPRLPTRFRLPFDSVVEIGVAQAPVQSRTELAVGGRPLPDEDTMETHEDNAD